MVKKPRDRKLKKPTGWSNIYLFVGQIANSPFFKGIYRCFMVCNKRTLNLEQIHVYISYT